MMCDFIFLAAVPLVISKRLLMASCKVLNLLSPLNIHNYNIILVSFAFALSSLLVIFLVSTFGCRNLSPCFYFLFLACPDTKQLETLLFLLIFIPTRVRVQMPSNVILTSILLIGEALNFQFINLHQHDRPPHSGSFIR